MNDYSIETYKKLSNEVDLTFEVEMIIIRINDTNVQDFIRSVNIY